MAELADALDSGSSVSNDVEVRVLLTAPYLTIPRSLDTLGFFSFCLRLVAVDGS
jgi:hypothetical protein